MLVATQLCECGAKITVRRLDDSAIALRRKMIEIEGQALFPDPGVVVRLDLEPAYALVEVSKDEAAIAQVLRVHRCRR